MYFHLRADKLYKGRKTLSIYETLAASNMNAWEHGCVHSSSFQIITYIHTHNTCIHIHIHTYTQTLTNMYLPNVYMF